MMKAKYYYTGYSYTGYIKKTELVQVLNPKTHCYTLIDKERGVILSHHYKRNTPYKDVEIRKPEISTKRLYIQEVEL